MDKKNQSIVRYKYFITNQGRKEVEKFNGNICGFYGDTIRKFVNKFNKCKIPDSLDVNWEEKVSYPDNYIYGPWRNAKDL